MRTYRSMASTASHKLLISLLVLLSITLAHSEDASADLTHTRGKHEAELEAGSQIVHSSYGAFEDVVNGPPSATPSKVEIKPSPWRFLDLLNIEGAVPHTHKEALNHQAMWHKLASTLIPHTFLADKLMQYQLSRLLRVRDNTTYFPYYIDATGRLVAALNGSVPEDIFQSIGFMIIGSPCLTASYRGHVPALIVSLPEESAPILQVNQEVYRDEEEDCNHNRSSTNSQTVNVEYVGDFIDAEDSIDHENRTAYSYSDLLLGTKIDKRSVRVRIDQDMVVEQNCTSNCPTTTTTEPTTSTTEIATSTTDFATSTTEFATSTTEISTTAEDTTTTESTTGFSTFESSTVPETTTTSDVTTAITPSIIDTATSPVTTGDTVTTTVAPDTTTTLVTDTTPTDEEDIDYPQEEDGSILQFLQVVDEEDCDNNTDEFSQTIVIENEYSVDEFYEALHRLQQGELGHSVLETILSQNSSTSSNETTWYYMNDHSIVEMAAEEEYESDVHIGHGLVVILPVLAKEGGIHYIVLIRTFVDEPASPIIQIHQSFVNQNSCGCDRADHNTTLEHEMDVPSQVIQDISIKSNRSTEEMDFSSMTGYINMLAAVPEYERHVETIIIMNDIEGEDCETTTEPTSTTEIISTTAEGDTTTETSTTDITTATSTTEITTTTYDITTTPEITITPEITTTTPEITITPEITTTSPEITTTPETTATPDITTTTEITTTASEIPTTTTPTTPSTTPDITLPPDEIEAEAIIQVSQNSETEDCDNSSSTYVQSVVIENEFDKDDLKDALHRLEEGEKGHCIIETIYSQNASSSDNSSWYYMDEHEILWMEKEQEYESDVHVGHGLVVVLPVITTEDSVVYIVLLRAYVDEPASPIVQIYQTFEDESACGCEVDNGENTTSHNHAVEVIQRFTSISNYSVGDMDFTSMTDYITMLVAVPEHQRRYVSLTIENEIEGEDCETTTDVSTTIEATTASSTVIGSSSSTSESTYESTTEVTTSETTKLSSPPETTSSTTPEISSTTLETTSTTPETTTSSTTPEATTSLTTPETITPSTTLQTTTSFTTSEVSSTTPESTVTSTSPETTVASTTPPAPPYKEDEEGNILQVLQVSESEDCDNQTTEFNQID
ncbi:mucin-3A-like [Penaeus japonicus]|uniref:mucin-3A-like n=1 Tax=Penaeus japonicus TaxID=27405 RepID=UPI001C70FDB3|nr:mucin-3A-like [Penaeus japonicus]